MYKIGDRVKLRSGKTGLIAGRIAGGYWVILDDGSGRIRTPSYDVMGLAGTQRLDGGFGQCAYFTPTLADPLSPAAMRTLREAYTDAIDRLSRCKVVMAQSLFSIEEQAPVDMRLQMASYFCFNLAFGSPHIEYERLIGHCLPLIDKVFRGITSHKFIISEVDEAKLKLASGQLVAGYVPTFGLETLSMYLYGSSSFHYFKSNSPLSGEVHVNLRKLVNNPWQLCQTLIHEATHKFCRTTDVHYLDGGVSSMKTFIKFLGLGIPTQTDQIERVLTSGDDKRAKFTPTSLLANADSYAYFVMLMTD